MGELLKRIAVASAATIASSVIESQMKSVRVNNVKTLAAAGGKAMKSAGGKLAGQLVRFKLGSRDAA